MKSQITSNLTNKAFFKLRNKKKTTKKNVIYKLIKRCKKKQQCINKFKMSTQTKRTKKKKHTSACRSSLSLFPTSTNLSPSRQKSSINCNKSVAFSELTSGGAFNKCFARSCNSLIDRNERFVD